MTWSTKVIIRLALTWSEPLVSYLGTTIALQDMEKRFQLWINFKTWWGWAFGVCGSLIKVHAKMRIYKKLLLLGQAYWNLPVHPQVIITIENVENSFCRYTKRLKNRKCPALLPTLHLARASDIPSLLIILVNFGLSFASRNDMHEHTFLRVKLCLTH